MKITVIEALVLGIWDEIAEIAGYNVWAINEGMVKNCGECNNLDTACKECKADFYAWKQQKNSCS